MTIPLQPSDESAKGVINKIGAYYRGKAVLGDIKPELQSAVRTAAVVRDLTDADGYRTKQNTQWEIARRLAKESNDDIDEVLRATAEAVGIDYGELVNKHLVGVTFKDDEPDELIDFSIYELVAKAREDKGDG